MAKRGLKELTVTIANGEAVSTAVDFRNYGGGVLIMPAAWTTADLGFKVCGSSDGTFVKLADRSNSYGTDVSIDAAAESTAYPLPAFIFGAPYFKLWSHDGSGGDTNQDAARTITLFLKE